MTRPRTSSRGSSVSRATPRCKLWQGARRAGGASASCNTPTDRSVFPASGERAEPHAFRARGVQRRGSEADTALLDRPIALLKWDPVASTKPKRRFPRVNLNGTAQLTQGTFRCTGEISTISEGGAFVVGVPALPAGAE